MKQPVLITTGMHRSGTSLTSALLQSAGLDIGQRLLEANYGNPKGYFENKDFLGFQERVLYAAGLNPVGWSVVKSVSVPENFVHEAYALLEKNASATNPWGWKDPRTTLFLNFWHTILPEAKFLFVYRAPWEVLDSLYRRRDDIFYQNPELALTLWMSYNEAILEFFTAHPDKCLLVNAADVIAEPHALFEVIQGKLGIALDYVKSDIYDRGLYHQTRESQRPLLLKRSFPESLNLYHTLNAKADLAIHAQIPGDIDEPLLPPSTWVLRDWIDLRRAEYSLQAETQRALEESQQFQQSLQAANQHQQVLKAELDQAQMELQLLKTQTIQKESHLSQLKAQLLQSKSLVAYLKEQLTDYQDRSQLAESNLQEKHLQIATLKAQLDDKHHSLKLRRDKLQIRTGELQQAQDRIFAMETSKFWKLRKLWFAARRAIGLPGRE